MRFASPIASLLGHADGLPSAPDVWREALLLQMACLLWLQVSGLVTCGTTADDH